MVGVAGGDTQHQLAVIDQQARAGFERGDDLRVRQLDARRIARRGIAVEDEALVLFEHRRRCGELADAQLRPLQVGEDRGRPPQFLFEPADRRDVGTMHGMVPVAHVDAECIDPGEKQRADHLRPARCRPERGEDAHLARARGEELDQNKAPELARQA
jgi:hypothetical protein